jgi:predicted GIY-YIG superfamily endonuclease
VCKSWVFKYQLRGKRHDMGLGSLRHVSLAQARARAIRCCGLLAGGTDPIEQRDAEQADKSAKEVTKPSPLEVRIARKAQGFVDRGDEPACYLYRLYAPDGDLIYAGISMHPLRRVYEHAKKAAWHFIVCRILIEPFATREEAIAAEQATILTEYPKHNIALNHRHPATEMEWLHRGLDPAIEDLPSEGVQKPQR